MISPALSRIESRNSAQYAGYFVVRGIHDFNSREISTRVKQKNDSSPNGRRIPRVESGHSQMLGSECQMADPQTTPGMPSG
jgi:hypothetical protein